MGVQRSFGFNIQKSHLSGSAKIAKLNCPQSEQYKRDCDGDVFSDDTEDDKAHDTDTDTCIVTC